MLAMDTKAFKRTSFKSLADAGDRNGVELAVVIPTFNERDNIRPLLERLEAVLRGIRWEAILVDDDSPDGTANVVREIAQHNSQVRVIHRIGRRGLTSACVEGVLSSSAPCFAIINADIQHDESILPRMLERLNADGLDIIIGSRYAEEGRDERRIISRIATRAAGLVVKADLRDPMSGFFLMRRKAFDEVVRVLSQQGFKMLLDLFASAPRPLRFAEVPYRFGRHGESELDGMAAWEYGMLLADKLFGRFIPARFLLYGMVGGFGLGIHMIVLAIGLSLEVAFAASQTIAVITAMTFNFTFNNLITYRDRRLKGWDFAKGLLSFYAICSVGAVANIGVATFIYAGEAIWWLAGLAGALVGAVWNYSMSAFFTWRCP